MRIVFILLLLLMLGCNSLKKTVGDDSCLKKLQIKKELFDSFLVTESSFVKSIALDRMSVPDDYDKVLWQKKSGGPTAIKDTNTFKLMLVQNELLLTLDSLCGDRKLVRSEIMNLFGTPTQDNVRSLTYHFNIEGTRDCYDKESWPLPYGNCAFLLFEFDESNILTSWNHTYLFAYDLATPKPELSLDSFK